MNNQVPLIKCRSIHVWQCAEGGFLGGPHELHLDLCGGYKATIAQVGIREVIITSDTDTDSDELHHQFRVLDKLLMLLRGNFLSICKIEFADSDGNVCQGTDAVEKHIINDALSYYSSTAVFQGHNLEFCNFADVLDSTIFARWRRLLERLDIVHTMVLYNMANTGLPPAIALAFIIEAMEPLYEYLAGLPRFSDRFPAKTDSNDISLKDCLEKIIGEFGSDIFEEEYTAGKERFLNRLKNSRIRIMHIKRKYKDPFYDGQDALYYLAKLILLYRNILLQLIAIDYSDYRNSLIESVQYLGRFKSSMIT